MEDDQLISPEDLDGLDKNKPNEEQPSKEKKSERVATVFANIIAFFGPLFGVIISDYYLIKKGNLINKDIYSLEKNGAYYFSGGWHIKGVYSLILGFIFSASTIWNANLMFLQSFAWMIGAIVASITYFLLAKK